MPANRYWVPGKNCGIFFGRIKYIWRPLDGTEQLFDLEVDPGEIHDLSPDPDWGKTLAKWRKRMINELRERPEGFTDGIKLLTGRQYDPAMHFIEEYKTTQ